MATDNWKNTVVVTSSLFVARGFEALLAEASEFRVNAILTDLSKSNMNRLGNIDADIILIDPGVSGADAGKNLRLTISEYTDVPVVALLTTLQGEEVLKQFDAAVSIFDHTQTVIKKLRETLAMRQDMPKAEGEELTAREKEILICVAKGMLNKEIADLYNLSIYTVITHRKNITRKTGIKTVAGLTVYALLNNLIDMGSVE